MNYLEEENGHLRRLLTDKEGELAALRDAEQVRQKMYAEFMERLTEDDRQLLRSMERELTAALGMNHQITVTEHLHAKAT